MIAVKANKRGLTSPLSASVVSQKFADKIERHWRGFDQRFGPDKGLGVVVSEFDILFDGLFQFQRAAMSRSFDLSFGEQTKPPFH